MRDPQKTSEMEAATDAALDEKGRRWLGQKIYRLAALRGHYSLQELKELAAQKKLWGEYCEMPEHLSACPVCLDFFEMVLAGGDKADEEVLKRMRKIGRRRIAFLSPWMLKAAAILVLSALGAWMLMQQMANPVVKVLEGAFELADGSVIGNGSTAPDGSDLNSTRDTTAVFADGSKLMAAKDSQISFKCERFGGNSVQMLSGSIFCEISKQKGTRSFKVLTPAGEIAVVGTKFSVKSSYQNDDADKQGDGLRFLHASELGTKKSAVSGNIVTVVVEAGAVQLKNRHGNEVVLKPGQTAVMRGSLSVIDVFDPTGKQLLQ